MITRVRELLEKAHNNIDLNILVNNGLSLEDQEEYYLIIGDIPPKK